MIVKGVGAKRACAVCPGKIIIVGEHFCVYDKPAVVMAISLHAHVSVEQSDKPGIEIHSKNFDATGRFHDQQYFIEKGGLNTRGHLAPIHMAVDSALNYLKILNPHLRVTVDSQIPIGVGMGSSAAIAVSTLSATARFYGCELERKEIYDLAFASERKVHGYPSGVDHAACTYGGILKFRTSESPQPIVAKELLWFVVGNTGIPRSTAKPVAGVHAMFQSNRDYVEKLIAQAGEIASETVGAIERGDVKRVGELMDLNQTLLRQINVSNPRLELFIKTAKKTGALGAKLTGAGQGGCMIALTTEDGRERVAKAIRKLEGEAFNAEVEREGAHSWLEDS